RPGADRTEREHGARAGRPCVCARSSRRSRHDPADVRPAGGGVGDVTAVWRRAPVLTHRHSSRIGGGADRSGALSHHVRSALSTFAPVALSIPSCDGGGDIGGGTRGIHTVKVLPLPSTLSTAMSPP